MRRLAAQLEAGTVLVLDGRERELGDVAADVRWARVADDLIADIARPGDTIVTSDRGLIERLPAQCQVTPSRAFRRQLDG
jgi:uncharacterized protein YaiI (UPF0178 family)